MPNHNVIFAGGGSKNPSIMMLSDPDAAAGPMTVSQFPQGYSVYALAISPNGSRLAAGTKAGLLRVHSLTEFQAQENAATLFEVFHPPAVFGLAFLTDDILASGGLDGKIKLWSLCEKRQIGEISAHEKRILVLRSIGSLVLAGIGADGVLRVWDMDTLEMEYQSDPFVLPKIYALTSLDYHWQTGLLMHPSRNGDLYTYDTRNKFAMRLTPAHNGSFSALACSNNYVATAGSQDATIKLWSPGTDEPFAEASAPASVLALGWLGPDAIMTIYSDGSSQTWKTNGNNPLPGQRLYDHDLRTTAGLPVELMARYQITLDKQWRDDKVAKAKELMNQPERQKELAAIVDELNSNGFSAEAALILADAAKAQNQLLWQLQSHLALAQGLGDSKAAIPSLYELANLLVKLNEPKIARDYYEKILQIDAGSPDIEERITQMNSNPLLSLDPKKGVRGDLTSRDTFLRELEKDTLLNKKFPWRVVHEKGKQISVKANLDAQQIANAILKPLEEFGIDTNTSSLQQVTLFQDGRSRDITWIYLPSTDKTIPIALALEINTAINATEFIPYRVFDIAILGLRTDESTQQHNQRIKEAWMRLLASPQTKRWLADVYRIAMENAKLLASSVLVREDDEF